MRTGLERRLPVSDEHEELRGREDGRCCIRKRRSCPVRDFGRARAVSGPACIGDEVGTRAADRLRARDAMRNG
jgi:hypothetical protein